MSDTSKKKVVPMVRSIETLEEFLRVNNVVSELLNELHIMELQLKIGLISPEEHQRLGKEVRKKMHYFERQLKTYKDD